MEFQDTITDAAQLRSLLGEPVQRAVDKALTSLNQHCKAFISRSPFVLIGSSNASGHMDVSPKGDPSGFVRVLDDSTLLIPDRPGNRRADTYTNVLENPNVGLIFLVPGMNHTLRVSGTAEIVRDADLLDSMAVRGKIPALALGVKVREAFFHCSKCAIRSDLWNAANWPDLEGLPSLAETLLEAAKLPASLEEVEQHVREAETERLY